MTLSRNKAKPGKRVLSCWEAPSAATGLRHCQRLFLLLCFTQRCRSLGRLVLGQAEGTTEVMDAGAVGPTLWCGAGVLPTGLFFRRGRQSGDAGLAAWLRDGGAWRKAGLLAVAFSCQNGKVPGFPSVVLTL